MLHQLYDAILNAISNQQNQFLSGGLVLMLVGAVAAYARRLPGRAYHWILSRFIITLDITNEDPVFLWLAGWLSMQPYSRRARNLSVTTYREKNDDVKNELSFAGVLNALDGVASREGWVIFMTTNHKERLDPALIRKGRADHHFEFGYATAYQGASIFSAFFPGSEGAETFGRIVEQRSMVMCDVQGHLVDYQHSAVEALAALELPEAVEEVA